MCNVRAFRCSRSFGGWAMVKQYMPEAQTATRHRETISHMHRHSCFQVPRSGYCDHTGCTPRIRFSICSLVAKHGLRTFHQRVLRSFRGQLPLLETLSVSLLWVWCAAQTTSYSPRRYIDQSPCVLNLALMQDDDVISLGPCFKPPRGVGCLV